MACLLRCCCCCLCILHAMLPIKILGYNFDMVLLAGTGSRRGESIEAFKMQGWQVASSGFDDVNDGIGVKEVGGSLQLLESSVVSELVAGKEKLPPGAGEYSSCVLEAHDLVSVCSWWDGRPTFFGNGCHCSMLDHLSLPSALLQAVRTAGPLMRLGNAFN